MASSDISDVDCNSVTVSKAPKKTLTPERLAQLAQAREMALSVRKDKSEFKKKEKALVALEDANRKRSVESRMLALNPPSAPKRPVPSPAPPKTEAPPKKKKQIVYVDPSSSDEIEYVRRPKVEKEISRADYQDQIHRMRREQLNAMMFSNGRGY